jgi:hypothetical protein
LTLLDHFEAVALKDPLRYRSRAWLAGEQFRWRYTDAADARRQ